MKYYIQSRAGSVTVGDQAEASRHIADVHRHLGVNQFRVFEQRDNGFFTGRWGTVDVSESGTVDVSETKGGNA